MNEEPTRIERPDSPGPPDPVNSHSGPRFGDICLLFIAGAVLFTFQLGMRNLWAPDEGRYAEIGREMLATGDWLTPRLDYAFYFEKPPLVYWLTGFFIRVFGPEEWAVRLPSVVGALLGIVSTYLLGCQIRNRKVGLTAALVLASSPLYFILARFLVLDMVLTGCVTASIVLYLGWMHGGGWAPFIHSSLFIGLATLTKGPIAIVLFGFALLPYSLQAPFSRLPRPLKLITYTAFALSITAPWFILVSRANPTFANFFFIHEHLERFLTDSHKRSGSTFYFVPVLLIGAFPWIAFLKMPQRRPKPGASSPPVLLFIGWIGLTFLFFTISKSKLPPYILPIFPPLAVWIACGLDPIEEPLCGRPIRFWVVAGILVILALALSGINLSKDKSGLEAVQIPIVIGLLAGASCAILGGWLARCRSLGLGVSVLALGTWIGLFGFERAAKIYEPSKDGKVFAETLRSLRLPGEKIMIYGTSEEVNPLPFYLEERVIISGHFFGELEMAREMHREQDADWLVGPAEAEDLMMPTQPRIWVVTKVEVFPYFLEHPNLRVTEIKRVGDMILFTNREVEP